MYHKKMAAAAACLFIVLSFLGCSNKEKPADDVQTSDGNITPRYQQDTQEMESALKEDPTNKALLVKLGNVYFDWGQDEVAKKGNLAEPVSKWQRAIECYTEALKKDPTDVNVRVDRAYLMNMVGDTDKAIEEFRLAKKQDPKHPQARINLVDALGRKGDFKAAVTEWDEMIKVMPEQKDNAQLASAVEGYRQAMKEKKK